MDRLADLIGGLQRPDHFKLGKFDGSGDVQLFLLDFDSVRVANRWDDAAALLHLKAALTDTAAACKRGADVDQVRNALRLRFGITPKQARDQIEWIRREPGQSLQALASEVDRLVGLGFANIPEPGRTHFAINTFKKALDHKAVEQHLLAVPTETLADTVRAADEFMSISKSRAPKHHSVHAVSTEAGASATPIPQADLAAVLKGMQETQQQILKHIEGISKGQPGKPSWSANKKERSCFRCKKTDHFIRDCPEPDNRPQGNANSPQQ